MALPKPFVLLAKRSRFVALRPDDLVTVQFDLVNLRLDTANPKDPKLVVADATLDAYLVVRFQPQHIAERAYFETSASITDNPPFNSAPPPPPVPGAGDPLDPPGSVAARMAGASRLVFRIPRSSQGIPFRLEALLDWSRFQLALSPTALGQATAGPIVAPTGLETALELPYRLFISPAEQVAFLHARTPKTHAGWTELWHTRVASIGANGPRELSDSNTIPLRAIWSPDFTDHAPLPAPADVGAFESSLSPRDRAQIVILSAGASGYFVPSIHAAAPGGVVPLRPGVVPDRPVWTLPAAWVPSPIRASRLFLSALGAWLTSHGSWPSPPSYDANDGSTQSLDLTEWRHIAVEGRDEYVRVVYDGYLYPFGHRASLVKVTERKVVPPVGGLTTPTAYLRQHMYVVVREREKTYDPAPYVHHGREMPFLRSVRLETAVTPDIDKPQYIDDGTAEPASFWVDVGGEGFPFHVSARDAAGARVDMHAQLIFVSVAEQSITKIQTAYAAAGDRRPCRVSGQKIAYADPAAGDTVLRTSALVFDTQVLQPSPPYTSAPFLPLLAQATVTVPVLEALLGRSDGVDVTLWQGYLDNGIDAHAGVFAQLTSTPPVVGFSADRAGGFATPTIALSALSARKGLVAGSADDAAAGLIDPGEFFGGVSVPGMVFGTIPLKTLIPVPLAGKADASRNAPEIRTRLAPNAQHPQSVVVNVDWQPDLQPYDEPPVKLEFNQNGGTSQLVLHAKMERSLTGGAATSEVSGKLTSFKISLFGVIALNVDEIRFDSKNGAKPTVHASLPSKDPVVFDGPLSFVQTLADVLPPGIFGGTGLSIQVKPDRIRATFTLGLPSITVGVFAIEHISIMTGLDLPFIDGKPAFEFGFASRSSPFLILVECLGGGGFIHLVVDADGVEMVEGALEFGAELSMDFGVASGSVHVMAGIYFKLAGTSSDLTGFVDIGGEVSVLGIISVSIDLNLSLSYETSNGKSMVQGRATLTISVHIVFFSISVSLSVERSFGGGAGDPKVDELISRTDWSTYAAAFA